MRSAVLMAVVLSGCVQQQQAITLPPLDDVAQKYPDLRTLWSRSVTATCSPNGGVCHNDRQFPDLQTVSGMLSTVNSRCNQIRDDPMTIDNLCEPLGDMLKIGDFFSRIGTVVATPSSGTPTALTLTLHDPIPAAATGAPAIVRQMPGLPAVVLPIPVTALAQTSSDARAVTLSWAALNATVGAVPGGSLAQFLLPPRFAPGDTTQVQLGDPNHDGVFGADLGGALVKPGQPLESYLVLRVLAPLPIGGGALITNIAGPASTEAQMPAANIDHWDSSSDLIALWCWIAGMKADGSNADGPIDYAHCNWTPGATPGAPGDATRFKAVYTQILQPVCSGCHRSGGSAGGSLILDDLQAGYATLLGTRGSGPSETATMPFVTAGDPDHSYLYLKVAGDTSISGARMPLGGALSQQQVDALRAWIAQGANDN